MSHREPLIEIIRRGEDGEWTFHTFLAGQAADSVGCALDVDEIYSDPLAPPAA